MWKVFKVYKCKNRYIYIYIYICRERERERVCLHLNSKNWKKMHTYKKE